MIVQTTNPFLYNTFSVSTNPRTLTSASLEVGNGNVYPELEYDPSTDISRVYRDVCKYVYANNDYQNGTLLNIHNFVTIFPFLYFDLRHQKPNMKDGTTKITFKYKLSAATNADYSVFALVLYEQDVELIQQSGKLYD